MTATNHHGNSRADAAVGTGMQTTWSVEGMHCGGCETKITKAVEGMESVTAARADAKSGRLRVTADEPVGEGELARTVAAAGDYRLGPRVEADPYAAAAALPAEHAGEGETDTRTGYRQLATLVALILIASLTAELAPLAAGGSTGGAQAAALGVMANFMAGFFLAFGFFKLLDLPGFVSGFARYDLVAGAFRPWAWVYPFVEVGLGLAYLARLSPVAVNVVTLAVMLVGGVGVVRTLMKKDRVKCACLGTVIDLPLGAVTLLEDFGMAAMAAAMLIIAAA